LQETIQKEKKRATDAASTGPKKTKGKKVPEMYLVNSKKGCFRSHRGGAVSRPH
jgi:hypothetical protein